MGDVNCSSAVGIHIQMNVLCVCMCFYGCVSVSVGLCVSVMRPRSCVRSCVYIYACNITIHLQFSMLL